MDSVDGAAVRIAMTVAGPGKRAGRLLTVAHEEREDREAEGRRVVLTEKRGLIFANLQTGANIGAVKSLRANARLTSRGVMLFGSGFIISAAVAGALGLGRVAGLEKYIRPYLNGRDMLQSSRNAFAIDFFGLRPSVQTGGYLEERGRK